MPAQSQPTQGVVIPSNDPVSVTPSVVPGASSSINPSDVSPGTTDFGTSAPGIAALGTTGQGNLNIAGLSTASNLSDTPSEANIDDSEAETVADLLDQQIQNQVEAESDNDSPAADTTNPASAGFGTNVQSSIADILLERGELTSDQKQEIELEAISTGKSIDSIAEEKRYVSEEQFTRAKAELHGIPFVKIADTGSDPQALDKLPESVANTYHILPLSYDKQLGTLTVAMEDPLNLSAIDFAERKSGLKLITRYAMPSELKRTIAEHYAQSLSGEVTAALEQTAQVAQEETRRQNLSALSQETIRQAPITKIVQTLVSFAMKARASDIHIEPLDDKTRVRYRIDGILQEKLVLPSSVHEAVVSRVKILSGLKIDEKRVPQDGRFNFVSDDEEVDLRVSTLPTIHGEKIVMRLLKKNSTVPSLQDLGLGGMALRKVEDSIKVPHGIILVTGPTGSGKTTTLYSVLDIINTPKVNIMTLEDPVEYQMTGVNQVQINPQAGLTFASGLRSFLRQDPNVIMVGEIRDSETSELAIQASLTGHLVFSTLHTSSAAGALPRLLDMGAEPFLLASSMTCILAQRVARRINPDYKEEYHPDDQVVADIEKVLGKHFDNWLSKNNKTKENFVLYKPVQERPPTEPEYKGRIGIFEVMQITEEIGKLVLDRKPASDIENLALADGMLLMKQDGYIKALEGVTTIEEVLRIAEI